MTRLEELLLKWHDQTIAEEELPIPMHFGILAAIEDFPGIDQRRLAVISGLDHTNVGQIIDALEVSRSTVERGANAVRGIRTRRRRRPSPTPPLRKLDGAQEGRLLELLAQSAGRYPDFSFVESPAGSFDELNSALRLSSTVLQGREFVKAGPATR